MWIWFDPAPADGFSKLQGVGCGAKAGLLLRPRHIRNRGVIEYYRHLDI